MSRVMLRLCIRHSTKSYYRSKLLINSERHFNDILKNCRRTLSNSQSDEAERVQAKLYSDFSDQIKFLDQEHIRTITYILCQNGLKEHFCIDYFSNGLHFFQSDASSLKDAINFLSSYGFSGDLTLKMLINFPELLIGEKANIIKTINILRLKFNFKDSMIPAVIAANPTLIDINEEALDCRFENLLKYFKKNHIRSLIMTCPQVLFENWESNIEKIDYILFEMNYDQKQIVQSELFRHSLNHIKSRHLLLIRSGIWQKPVKLRNTGIFLSLKKILCTDNQEFSLLIGINSQEVEVFEKIIQIESEFREKLREEEENDDDDRNSQESNRLNTLSAK